MDINTKLLMDELKSVKTHLKSSLGEHIGEVEVSLGKRIGAVEYSIADRFNQLEDAAKVFDEWKPKVDALVAELRSELGAVHKSDAVVEQLHEEMTALRKPVSHVVLDSELATSAGVLKFHPVVAAATSSAGHPAIGPSVGHGVAHHHQGFESMAQPSVKATMRMTGAASRWLQSLDPKVKKEELVDPRRRRSASKSLPMLPTATAPDHGSRAATGGALTDDRRPRGMEDKLNTLRSYRRARGLCVRCGEKWSHDHKCPEALQLHTLQEFWDMCNLDESNGVDQATDEETSAQVFAVQVLASVAASSLVRTDLASKLTGGQSLVVPPRVHMANGNIIECPQLFSALSWEVQQCPFSSDFLALPMPSYDMILGMDWLAHHSPMQIDWQHKWLLIPHGQTMVRLQGKLMALPEGSIIQVMALSAEDTAQHTLVHPAVSELLQEFDSVFAPPTGYPPARPLDHAIPLIPGTPPVQVCPYRYPPVVKDEIERQVTDMLRVGIIQPSNSQFSSPVLLVKKKDGSFRFCVDFRHLNAVTVKAKYPVPVIKELLDELTHASWFTCLDLTAGYHQIRLQPSEEPKTAFQTHSGQYEFRVMAFGLTGSRPHSRRR
ncbi:uncharacterized protein [Miscanthus floridulus]|uniref:uncharacterized protein n=1 Tax=Miscanthus floridulus TaxID=154761 RepID=UPI003459BD97